MELMSVLGALTGSPGEPEVPDARDPVTAAAFGALLAGLLPAGAVQPPAAPATDGVATAAVPSVGTTVPPAAATPAAETNLMSAASPFWGDLSTDTADAQPQNVPDPTGTGASSVPPAGATPTWGELSAGTGGEQHQSASAADASAKGRPVETTSATGPAPFWGHLSTEVGGPQPQDASPAAIGIEAARPSLVATRPPADPVVPDAAVEAPPAAAVTIAPNLTPPDVGGSDDDAEPDLELPPPGPHLTGLARAEAVASPAAAVAHAATPVASSALERALAAQLVERVGTLRHSDDGDYELSLQLEPADLGRVELRVRLEAGVVHVHVGAHSADTGDLLRRSLPELRAALLEAGLDAGRLDVGAHSGQPGAGGDPRGDAPGWAPTTGAAGRPAAARPATATVSVPTGARRGVDVLL